MNRQLQNKNFRTVNSYTAVTVLAILIILSISGDVFGSEVLDSICAVVDNEIILESEVIYGVNGMLLEQQLRYPTPEQQQQLRDQVLKAYITQKILLARAEEETLFVEDRLIDRELDRKYESMVQQIGSEQKLAEYFGRPLSQIKRDLRKGVEDAMLIERVKQGQLASLFVRRQDVVDFYNKNVDDLPMLPEQVELSHILITAKVSPESRKAAEDRCNMIYTLLTEGHDFDSIAYVHSDGPSAKDESKQFGGGGRLGWTERNDLVPEYEEIAYQLDPLEISEIIESRYGLHIIRLLDRKGEKISTQHILVQMEPSKDDWNHAFDLTQDFRSQIESDEASFEELAQTHSDDTQSAGKGGKLEPVVAGELTSEFQDAIASLDQGETSVPFETVFGWHLIRLDDRLPERRLSLSDDWQLIEQYATMMKRETIFMEWVESLKKDHYIWPAGL